MIVVRPATRMLANGALAVSSSQLAAAAPQLRACRTRALTLTALRTHALPQHDKYGEEKK